MQDEDNDLMPVEEAFTDLGTAEKRPLRWVIDNVLPEGLVFMVGPPKDSFKSTITMAMAALVAEYKCLALPADWRPAMRGPVMIISHEGDAGELRCILEDGMGVKVAADEGILVAKRPEEFMLDTEEGQAELMHYLKLRPPALLIIDPLANAHTLDEKESGDMMRALSPVRRWAKENQACALIVHHTRKLDGDDRNYRASDARGTSALFGMCDAMLIITPGQNPFEVYIDAKFKRAETWQKSIQLGIWGRKGQRGGEPLREVDKIILAAIDKGSKTVIEVSAATGLNEKSCQDRTAYLIGRCLITKPPFERLES